jgi:hypothetical protein
MSKPNTFLMDYSKFFKQVRAKLNFWMYSEKSQYTVGRNGNFTSFDEIAKTRSFRKFQPEHVKDVIELFGKLEPSKFEVTEKGVRIPLNHPVNQIKEFL